MNAAARALLVGVIVGATMGACAKSEPGAPPWGQYSSVLVEKGHSSTAPRTLRHQTELGAQKFGFIYDDGYDRLDTGAGKLTRLLRPEEGGPRTARIRLTAAEYDTLYRLLARAGYFESPGVVGRGSRGMSPVGEPIDFEVVVDSVRKSVHWEPTLPELVPQMAGRNPRKIDPEEPGLFEFEMRLKAMLRRREVYRRLPRGLPTL